MTRAEAAEAERAARLAFKAKVLALDTACVVHPFQTDCEGVLEAHHVITQQQLRKAGRLDLLWDPRNGATVCELAHRRHTRAIQRIPLRLLPDRCVRFAAEYGFSRLLNRYYT